MTLFATVVDAWWSDPQANSIGPYVLGGLSLLYMSLFLPLMVIRWREIGRRFVFGCSLLMILLSALSLTLGLTTLLLTEQPWHVWFPLFLTGCLGLFWFGPLPLFARIFHRQLEQQLLGSRLLREEWTEDRSQLDERTDRGTT